jgi:anti-anti-sigma regulatory factor
MNHLCRAIVRRGLSVQPPSRAALWLPVNRQSIMFFEMKQGAPHPFSISVRSGAGASLSGVLDCSTVDLFTAVIEGLSYPTVIVDVSRLVDIDEDGIAAMASEDARRRDHSGRLVVVGSPGWLQERFAASGLERMLPLAPLTT